MAYQEYTVRVYKDGRYEYLDKEGRRHRLDGPAWILKDGRCLWFIDGAELTEEEHKRATTVKEMTISEISRAMDKLYEIVGMQVYKNEKGQLHRVDGPALIYTNGEVYWYLNGVQLTEEEHKRATNPSREMTIREIEALLGHSIKVVKES